jgi:hypothetical protein
MDGALPAPAPVRLDALLIAAEGGAAPEPSEEELARDRARALDEAATRAAELRGRWREAPPRWNPPTGRGDVDGLVWFRYVEAEPLDAAAVTGPSSPDP